MKPNKGTYLYIGFLFLLAIFLSFQTYFVYGPANLKDVLFWGVLSIVAESLLIAFPNIDVGVSVGFAIDTASILVGGPLLGITTSVLGFLFRCANIPNRGYSHLLNTPYYITVFNISQSAIISAIMGHVYVISGGVVEEFHLMQTILILFIGIIVNSVVISTLISITEGKKFTEVCFSSLKGIMLNAGSVGILGIIMALAHLSYGFGAVVLFFGPLLLARHSFKLYIDMRNVYISTIETLGKIIEAKDPYTSGHANRVKKYSIMLAEAYGLDYDRIQNIKRAAVLHDIGKIAINDNILHKSTKLTQSEFAHIMKHPTVGADIISEMDFLKDVADIIRYHHERYDGTGYPEGIGGDEVPLEAYILAIADAYDAMTTDRPYRKALERKEALKEIGKNAGSQFHPSLAEKFISIMAN